MREREKEREREREYVASNCVVLRDVGVRSCFCCYTGCVFIAVPSPVYCTRTAEAL